MKVTIITVAFNSASTIGDTLASVASQTHPDIEHLVIDGNSTDATMDIVRRHGARVAKALSEPDRGIYDAMNKGLAMATGDLVGFLNADDVLNGPGAVAALVEAASPGRDMVYADLVYVRADDLGRVVRHWRSGPFRRAALRLGWMPPHPTFYVRRDVLRSAASSTPACASPPTTTSCCAACAGPRWTWAICRRCWCACARAARAMPT